MKYDVKINKNDINKINKSKTHFEIEEIESINDDIKFKTNEKSLKRLIENIEKIEYENIRKKKVYNFLKKYFISIIFLFLMVLLLVNDSLIIKEVVFINENTYDENVQNYIENNFKKVLCFNYLNEPINELNNELRNKFYFYEWINVYKRGNKLVVTIDKQDEKSFINTKSNIKGDIVSSNDGIIRYYFVKEGVCLIKDNQSVKKGDVLVTGNLGYYNEKKNFIHPAAIVLAEIVTKETIKVKKTEKSYIRTGKIKNDYFYSFFKKEKEYFDLYEYEDFEIYKLGAIKKIKRTYYEITEIINVYDYDNAFLYATSLIQKTFGENKIHKKEQILDIELIKNYEDQTYYYYTFLIKKIVNISKFKAVRLEENEKKWYTIKKGMWINE